MTASWLAASIVALADSLGIRGYINYKNSAMGPGNSKKETPRNMLSSISSNVWFIDVSLK